MNRYPLSLALAYKLLTTVSSPGLRARLAAWLWFRPLRKAASDAYLPLRDTARSIRLPQASGGPLRIWGTGDSGLHVHLIHGWGGRWDQFSVLIEACVMAGHRVVAQDFAGHGEARGSSTDLELWMADIRRQLKAVPAARRVYVCHSLGLAPIARLIAKGDLAPAAVVAINPPTRFDFLLLSFLRKCRLPESLAPQLEKRVLARVPQARQIGDIDINALADRTQLLYLADRNDREVPFSEHAAAKARLGSRFITTQGFGHNRILASHDLSGTVVAYLETLAGVRP